MPQMLARIRKGSPDAEVTILIATGFHRATTRGELVAKFGEEIVANEKIAVHDSSDDSMLVEAGTLPSGGRLVVNRLVMEADLVVSEGFIEPHFFAGFSGGRKSVLPGVVSRETVLANHCSEFIQSPFARTGNLEGNPLHRDMLFAAETAKLAFIVNVVINGEKRVVKAVAGHFRAAHEAGCAWLKDICRVRVPESDIVVTSNGGYPLDQNVYQAVKGMTAAESVCRDGGVIVMVASCADGHGGESFYCNLSEAPGPEAVLEKVLRVPRTETKPDQWEFQILARILSRHHVILVTKDCDHGMLRSMHLKTAATLAEALAQADALVGSAARIAVIPDGVSVIAERA
jgi:nickel-dependent lactate racemase